LKTERMLFQEKMRSRLSAGQYEMITDGLCGFEETNHKTDNRLMHIGLLSLQESAAFVILYSHFIVKIESSQRIEAKAKSVPFSRTILLRCVSPKCNPHHR